MITCDQILETYLLGTRKLNFFFKECFFSKANIKPSCYEISYQKFFFLGDMDDCISPTNVPKSESSTGIIQFRGVGREILRHLCTYVTGSWKTYLHIMAGGWSMVSNSPTQVASNWGVLSQFSNLDFNLYYEDISPGLRILEASRWLPGEGLCHLIKRTFKHMVLNTGDYIWIIKTHQLFLSFKCGFCILKSRMFRSATGKGCWVYQCCKYYCAG